MCGYMSKILKGIEQTLDSMIQNSGIASVSYTLLVVLIQVSAKQSDIPDT
jgi:hypothetical protein